MILYTLHKTPLRKVYFKKWGKKWVKNKITPFESYLSEGEKILDIGSGNGLVAWELKQRGFDVTPLDIASQAFDESVAPIVYDGNKMPFEDDTFDVAIILSVLHHTENPLAILKEAGRVAKRVIINEDIYFNTFQKYMVYSCDTFVNLGYSPCPRTNKNDEEWKAAFSELGFELLDFKHVPVLKVFKQGIYNVKTS